MISIESIGKLPRKILPQARRSSRGVILGFGSDIDMFLDANAGTPAALLGFLPFFVPRDPGRRVQGWEGGAAVLGLATVESVCTLNFL